MFYLVLGFGLCNLPRRLRESESEGTKERKFEKYASAKVVQEKMPIQFNRNASRRFTHCCQISNNILRLLL